MEKLRRSVRFQKISPIRPDSDSPVCLQLKLQLQLLLQFKKSTIFTFRKIENQHTKDLRMLKRKSKE
jgi:hypothetical protein